MGTRMSVSRYGTVGSVFGCDSATDIGTRMDRGWQGNGMWQYWLLGIIGLGVVAALAVAVRYHRTCRVTQPLHRFLFRYFLGDYLVFPVRWCPGIVGIGLRYFVYKWLFRRMGRNVTILEGAYLSNVSGIEVGDNTSIGFGAIMDGTAPIRIGRWVRMGPRVVMITTKHNFERRDVPIKEQGNSSGPISIGDDVWLGAAVMIMPNVTIETGAVIGAGSIVTKDIPEYAIAVGNPARVVKMRE